MNEIQLKTIGKNGKAPVTRLEGAAETAEIVNQLIEADQKRNATDAKVKGMIDGNPPYNQAMLNELNQSWRCNVNWRIGEAFLNIGLSTYWDIISEGPTKATCLCRYGESSDQQQEWGGIITEEYQRLNDEDSSLTNMFRDSQHDMVLYRMGPVMWHDAFDFRAKPIRCSNLLTLDKTKSHINEWKLMVVRTNYTADELYACIHNEKAARAYGWNTTFAREVLQKAYPLSQYPQRRRDWSYFQQQIRNNDLHVSMQAESIPIAHVLVREFAKDGEVEGRISHFMVVEDQPNKEYLYKRIGRYANWRQVLCPFYYDTGDGEHHSIKGLGVKAYGALDRINRLMCHEADMAMVASGMNFQFQGAVDKEKIQLTTLGPINFWDSGINLLPGINTGQMIAAPGMVRQTLLNTVTSNLAQYRQKQEDTPGNPPTARQVSIEAENHNFINKSGLSYYFEQEDDFYSERFRRATNPNIMEHNPGGKEALAFQARCYKRGVPKEALQRCYVTATRTVGYGSADARLQALMRLLSRYPLYDETGQKRILEDVTAADVGHSLMRRYIPESESNPTMDFQKSQAQDKVGLIRQGMEPMVTADQNPVIYADTYIKAAADALASLEQGGNPAEVVAFVDGAGQAAAYQLQRFANDPMRKQAHKELMDRLNEVGRQNDQLKQQLQQQAEQQQAQGEKTQQFMTDEELKQRKNEADISRKERKLQVDLAAKNAKTRQGLAEKDVTTAQTLEINRLKAQQQLSKPQSNGKK